MSTPGWYHMVHSLALDEENRQFYDEVARHLIRARLGCRLNHYRICGQREIPELAEELGWDILRLCGVLVGDMDPSVLELTQLCHALDLDLSVDLVRR